MFESLFFKNIPDPKTIWITRTSNDLVNFCEDLQDIGFVPYVDSIFNINFLEKRIKFNKNQVILFTSKNAISSYFFNKGDSNISCYCVGKSSADFALEKGIVNVKYADGNVKNLIEKIKLELNPNLFFLHYLRGKEITIDLESELKKFNYKVSSNIVYEIIYSNTLIDETKKMLLNNKFYGVFLCSSNSAKSFLKLTKGYDIRNLKTYVLSENIANIIKPFFNNISITEKKNQSSFIKLLSKENEAKKY